MFISISQDPIKTTRHNDLPFDLVAISISQDPIKTYTAAAGTALAQSFQSHKTRLKLVTSCLKLCNFKHLKLHDSQYEIGLTLVVSGWSKNFEEPTTGRYFTLKEVARAEFFDAHHVALPFGGGGDLVEQHAVFERVDDLGEFAFDLAQCGGRDLALEDRVLHPIQPFAQAFADLLNALDFDIVNDDDIHGERMKAEG